jgi:hypothetical protein
MSTTESTAASRLPALRPDPATAGGAAVALICTLAGQYVDTPWQAGSDSWDVDFAGGGGFGALAVLVAFVAVATIVVSAVVRAARAAGPTSAARRAAWLAVVGAVALAVFWTGLPPVLAAGAAGLAVSSRRRPASAPAAATAALVLAVLTIAAALFLAVTG